MILVFDLDGTLFDMLSYCKSGDLAVANFMQKEWGISAKESYGRMLRIIESKGTSNLFDTILKQYHVYSKKAVAECLSAYRLHTPKIALYDDAARCLKRFKDYAKYIVTDGNKIVQHTKVLALGLDRVVKKAFITHRHGRHNAKPSPYCLTKIAQIEKVDPKEVVYIGDNPNKDFVGIKPLGFKTVRIMRGAHKDVRLTKHHDAHIKISSLDELTEKVINRFNCN